MAFRQSLPARKSGKFVAYFLQEKALAIIHVSTCVFPPTESVFLLETEQPKGLLVFGVFTSTR